MRGWLRIGVSAMVTGTAASVVSQPFGRIDDLVATGSQ